MQSVGECACTVESIDGPTPSDVGFSMPSLPTLPLVLRGTHGCDGDPAEAADAENLLLVEVEYTAPQRENPASDNAIVTVSTDDPETPSRDVNLDANGGGTPFCQLELSPQSNSLGLAGPEPTRDGVVSFGRVTVYWTKRLPIQLTNVGNTTCQITGVSFDDNTLSNEFNLEYEDGTPVSAGSLNLSVEPGAC